eukprot:s492_g15.t1
MVRLMRSGSLDITSIGWNNTFCMDCKGGVSQLGEALDRMLVHRQLSLKIRCFMMGIFSQNIELGYFLHMLEPVSFFSARHLHWHSCVPQTVGAAMMAAAGGAGQ